MKHWIAVLVTGSVTAVMLAVGLGSGPAPDAAAARCGFFSAPTIRAVGSSTKSVSSVSSKFNSSPRPQRVVLPTTTVRADASRVAPGFDVDVDDVIDRVEARFAVSATRHIELGESASSRVRVAGERYVRTERQSLRTRYVSSSRYLAPETCERTQRRVNWRATLITGNPHFAVCQDRRNLCAPR